MIAEDKIEVDVRLELQDYTRFNRWFRYKGSRLASYGSLILLGVFPLLYFLLTLGPALRDGEQPSWILLLPPAVIATSLILGQISAKRRFESSRLHQETTRYTFSSAGIYTSTPTSSGNMDWSNVVRVAESPDDFMLFLSLQQAYLIPKRFFPNSEQIERFRELAAKHVPPAPERKTFSGALWTLLLWMLIFIIATLIWTFK